MDDLDFVTAITQDLLLRSNRLLAKASNECVLHIDEACNHLTHALTALEKAQECKGRSATQS